MELTQLFKLIDAGFTKQDITALLSAQNVNTNEETPTDTPSKTPAPAPAAAPAPAPEETKPTKPEPSETDKLIAALGMKLDDLTSSIQAANVRNIEGRDPDMSADDIIARIINPHLGEGDK